MKTALLIIATGEKYRRYVGPLLESANRFFVPHDVVLWSDLDGLPESVTHFILKAGLGYPKETLYRYHTFFQQKHLLYEYDHLFYCDVDMLFVAPVAEEILSRGITATLHPGYVGTRGTPETRSESAAFCNNNAAYYCGGFQGGTRESYFKAIEYAIGIIDADVSRGIIPTWHDESAWNKYLSISPPAKVLGPEYCYPEEEDLNSRNYYKNIWKNAGLMDVKPILKALRKSR